MEKRDVNANEPGRVIDGEWQPWGGKCRCRRCRERIGREGFYRASRADYDKLKGEDYSKWYVRN